MEATAAVDSFRHELITPRGGVSHADPFFLCLPCDRCLFSQSKRLQVLHQRFYNSSISAARGRNRNRTRNLKTSKALLKSQAHQGTSLFTSAATNQRGVSKGGSREAQVRIPEYQEGTE